MQFTNNTVSNMNFIGSSSSLIDLDEEGVITAHNNLFFDIGYLATQGKQVSLPFQPMPADKKFKFWTGQINRF